MTQTINLIEIQEMNLLEKKPEEVTSTQMRKFCFRKPSQSIIVVSLTNKGGQNFEIEIDEATSRAIVKLFDSK